MARRARKSPLEKLEEELTQVRSSIAQYENCLETMRGKEEELQNHIMMERFKEVNELLEVQNLSLDDLKDMLTGTGDSTQIA